MSYGALIDEVVGAHPEADREAIEEIVALLAGLREVVTRADVEAWLPLVGGVVEVSRFETRWN